MHLEIIKSTAAATGNISGDYKNNPAALTDFFAFLPHQWREKLASVKSAYPLRNREALSSALLDYHRGLDAPRPVIDNVKALAEENTFVVTTGQQPGLLTGPLYTVYKSLSAVKLARRLSGELGVRVVPLFWSATEDHDLAETNRFNSFNRRDEIVHLHYPVPERYHGWRVGEIPLGEGTEFWARTKEALEDTDFKAQLLEMLKDTHRRSRTWGDWFARQMLALFGKWGLVLADSNLPPLRRLLTPVIQQAIEEPLLFSRLVNEQESRLAALGYKGQIRRPGHACCFFFIDDDGQRQRIDYRGGEYRSEKAAYSRRQLLDVLEEQPERFSCNVVLRPPGGDYLLPQLAYIGGDAEISYLSQLRPVYEQLRVPMPIVLPRHSLTLVEGRIRKILDRYHLDPVRLGEEGARQLKEAGRRYCRLGNDEFWRDLIRDVMAPLHLLKQEAEIEQMTLAPLESGINKIAWQLKQLEEKVVQQCKKNNRLLRERITRANGFLFPQNTPQERVISWFYFYNKYGDQLLPALLESLPEEGRAHQFMALEVA